MLAVPILFFCCAGLEADVCPSWKQAHIERLAWQMTSWRSLELTVRETMARPDGWTGRPLDFDTVIYHSVELATGQRYRDDRFEMQGKPTSHSTQFFDGTKGASLEYDRDNPRKQQQIIIHRHFGSEDQFVQTDRPRPLFWYWMGRKPLHRALDDAQLVGEREVMGRMCDVVLFEKQGGTNGRRDHIYYLDRKTSTPLKVELYANTEDRQAGRPVLIWTAEEIGSAQGRPIVTRSTGKDLAGKAGTHLMTREYVVELIAFDREFPKSMFWVEPEPGAAIFDTIKAKLVINPSAKAAAGAAGVTPPAPAVPANAIRAEPPGSGTRLVAPALLALGVVGVLAGLFLWWRR